MLFFWHVVVGPVVIHHVHHHHLLLHLSVCVHHLHLLNGLWAVLGILVHWLITESGAALLVLVPSSEVGLEALLGYGDLGVESFWHFIGKVFFEALVVVLFAECDVKSSFLFVEVNFGLIRGGFPGLGYLLEFAS